jgi:2-succinyl-6-hydroxy-2,4-cyclohexadiene-1-carboxylate synthase
MSETVVMLHGFGGTARHWDRVVALLDRERYSPLALELGDATPLSLAGAVELVAGAADGRFVLCGYSMGGRVALHAALAMPARISRLVLVSASAGIERPGERGARLSADELLAEEIERGSIEDFVARWRNTPLLAEDPDWVQEAVAEDTRRLTPQLLAATLRAYSAGRLEPLWGKLGSLAMPVTMLAGERDARYRELAQRLAGECQRGSYAIVPAAGHRIALEAPAAVTDAFAGPPARLAWRPW